MKLETPRDERRERIVTELVAKEWDCDWSKMGPYSPFDVYLMKERRIIALVEVRTLRRNWRDQPHFFMDLSKWFTLIQGEIGLNMPGFYIIGFFDGIYYVRVGELPVNSYRVIYSGRTDRGIASDQHPAIRCPTGELQFLCRSEGVFTAEDFRGRGDVRQAPLV